MTSAAAPRRETPPSRAEFDREFERLPAMMQKADRWGRLIAVSDMWLAKLGYAREEVIGRPISDFLAPDPPSFEASEAVERRMPRKDGRLIDVLVSVGVAADGDGASLAVIIDVSESKAAERRLVESEARYRELVEDQSEFVTISSPEGELRFVNRAYAEFLETVPEAMIGTNLLDYVPKGRRANVAEHLKTVLAGSETITNENQVVSPSGESRWISWTNRAMIDPAGTARAIHSVGRDIERRVEAERRLIESEQRYRLLADNGADTVFQLDRDFVLRYASPASLHLLGYAPEELVGTKPLRVVHPDDADRVAKLLDSLISGEAVRQEVINRVRRRDGRWIWVESVLRALGDSETGTPIGIVGAMRDISARKLAEDQLAKANRRLEALARRDSLTGLANRREFDEAFAREHKRRKRRKRSLALLMIDADWFKPYNDTHGHLAGDESLRRLGRVIADAALRATDIAARYGGEEFVVLLPDTDEAGGTVIGERIREAVARLAITHRASPLGMMTVSVGVAAIEQGSPDMGPEALLNRADRALYLAKEGGRNRVARASSLTGTEFVAA